MKVTGGEAVIRLIEQQGISTIAGIPGGANLPLYDALARNERMRHVLARHEQAAGFIAQGMARVTGKPGVCFATSGPGATNLLTAVADAKLDSVPMVCFTGQVPGAMIGTDAFQEVDTYGMSIPVTKHNFLVRSPEELLEVVPRAFRIAASGRPGPVWLDVPKDIQARTMEVDAWPDPGQPDATPPVSPEAVERAAAMINAARRPILYIGGGVIASEASRDMVSFAERASIPVASTLMGLGAMSVDHPLYVGMLGMHAARHTNLLLEEADLLIAVGVRFDDRATGRVQAFCPNAGVVHVDIDPSEIGKIRTPHVGIVGDVRDALRRLRPLVREPERPEWLARASELRRRHAIRVPRPEDTGQALGIVSAAARALPADAVVVTDVGQHQMWTAQVYPFSYPRQWLTSGGLGTMGFGLPTAIGAALARPDATVACFSGDGSLLMNIQELVTAAEQGANVKVILMDNRSLGLVHQQQELFYGNRIYASDYEFAPDYCRIAEGFGVRAYDLRNSADPARTLQTAFRKRGPALVHAHIDVSEKVYPMVPPGAANKDMIGANHAVSRF